MLRIGIFGVGHLGKIHLKCLDMSPFEVVGGYDPLLVDGQEIIGVNMFSNPESLMRQIDAAIISSTTTSHYQLAMQLLDYGIHVFVEKPLASNLTEAKSLAKLAAQKNHLVTQVGFVERFNPAYRYAEKYIEQPKFIEVHRLANFVERGTDVSVVSDLMIHDLDIILHIKKDTTIREIKANGVSLLTDSLDICNARLEFEDNSVVNITASRMSMKSMRKFRIFQDSQYISIDFADKKTEIINLSDIPQDNSMEFPLRDMKKYITINSSDVLDGNAIQEEQMAFYNCIMDKRKSNIDFGWACKVSEIAEEIESKATNAVTI